MKEKNHLVSNTFYLIAYTLSSSALNAIFWWLAARLYLPDNVGLAVVLISMSQLLTTIAQLGMNFGLIRFFQDEPQKGRLVSTALWTCLALGLGLGILTVLVGPWLSSSLVVLKQDLIGACLFMALVIFLSLFQICLPILVSLDQTRFYFLVNLLVLSSRLLILMMGVQKSYSLFPLFAFTTPLLVVDIFLIAIYLPRKISGFSISGGWEKGLWKKIGGYSLASFGGNILHDLPYQVTPQVVANFAGLAGAAYFYFPWTLSGLLVTFSSTISQSLFIEGSNRPDSFQNNQAKVLFGSLAIAIAGIIGCFIAGRFLLGLFGPEYAAQGVPILRILCLSVLPASIVYHRVAVLRIRNRTVTIIFLYGLILLLLTIIVFVLPIARNVLGISWGWLAAYSLAAIIAWFFTGKGHEKQA